MKNDYWVNFWQDYTTDITEKDEQSQVLRTFNKKPITEELWQFTLDEIDSVFNVVEGDHVLDLCSGNGLLSKHFLTKGASVAAVDISKELLTNLEGIEGIDAIHSDIRAVDFDNHTFDHILFYAGIQYLTDKEAIVLLQKIYNWLKPGGSLFIGDIPDVKKRWNFFNNEERHKVFFDNQLKGEAIVGNWFESDWFDNLTAYLGFKEGQLVEQDEKLIYSTFRFDYLYKK
ncbi:MAG: class I SAM-dependent methyltransferase [Aureispira sp.]|nr:class I SAM-dependent methyltransferase [Aureispira sp.]